MTQIKHVTKKEMLRRTGTNALGYTFPDKDLVLLEKGLTGAKKREVLAHEQEHMKNGEEGPFWGAVAGAALSYLGSKKQSKAAEAAAGQASADKALASQYYEPYRGVGEAGAQSLMDYIYGRAAPTEDQQAQLDKLLAEQGAQGASGAFGSPSFQGITGGRFIMSRPVDNTAKINALRSQFAREGGVGFGPQDPTMEEVTGGQGYRTRLGAIENSAAARGGLFSGNALRNIGEFGAAEYESERARRQQDYQQRLSNMMGLVGVGERAAGGSAGMAMQGSNALQNLTLQRGAAQSGAYSGLAGAIGQYEGQQQWNDFLNRAYPKAGQ